MSTLEWLALIGLILTGVTLYPAVRLFEYFSRNGEDNKLATLKWFFLYSAISMLLSLGVSITDFGGLSQEAGRILHLLSISFRALAFWMLATRLILRTNGDHWFPKHEGEPKP